jgi:hypothetical protein
MLLPLLHLFLAIGAIDIRPAVARSLVITGERQAPR